MAKSDDYWIHDESYRRFFCCQGISATSDRFTAASRWGNLHVAAPRAGLPRQRLFDSRRRKPAIRYYLRPQLLRYSISAKSLSHHLLPRPDFIRRSSPAAYRNTSGTALAQDRHDDMCQDVTVQRNSQRMVAHLLQRPLGHTYH